MTSDSEEKILADWNASDRLHFDDFDSLYRYLEKVSGFQGKQNKKNEVEDVVISGFAQIQSKLKEFRRRVRKTATSETTMVLIFRQRVKELKKRNRIA